MTKTYTDYLAELDDLLVRASGRVLTTDVALAIATLASFAAQAAKEPRTGGSK